jgi:hypothetical protein
MALHRRPGIEHRRFLEREDQLQLAQIVRERHSDLDDLARGEELGERRGEIHALQREEVYDACSGHLHEARQVVLALAECRPRLGVEAEHALRTDIGHRAVEVLRRRNEVNLPFVAPDRQLIDLLAGDRAPQFDRQRARARPWLR